jgi:hypothetical protein
MRWDQLFESLNDRFDDLVAADAAAEAADRQRVAMGSVPLRDRLAGSVGLPIRLMTAASTVPVSGVLAAVGPDWLLLRGSRDQQLLVRTAAVVSVEGLTARSGPAMGVVAARLDLRFALRGLVRDRSPVSILVGGGSDGTELTGTIDRVGADFVELARHAAWESRRAGTVTQVTLVPLAAVTVVRSHPLG